MYPQVLPDWRDKRPGDGIVGSISTVLSSTKEEAVKTDPDKTRKLANEAFLYSMDHMLWGAWDAICATSSPRGHRKRLQLKRCATLCLQRRCRWVRRDCDLERLAGAGGRAS